jgi:ATP-binding cassette subfamily B (MDR/TAP) protein 1
MRKGKLVEQGSHEDLLANEDGIYYGLINAQKLTTETAADSDGLLEDKSLAKVRTSETAKSDTPDSTSHASSTEEEEAEYKDKSFLQSGGKLIYEQRHHWLLYCFAGIGMLGAGGKSSHPPLLLVKKVTPSTNTS